ncbi:glycoside hydrolase family 2 protein [Paenibacillus endoradicis]|uniref:glycoside hydrolase family 2 protein n=1 Tax=Paenibacillus endoradicis TaxID=2972487 RepID=UPI002159748D|nr:glycoside hydrolase family 2 TIM barrel-domain containing protein [Paenibacillus endoradicis]MCR8658593.1 glycoside hydrolase family 2 protein [Paenibacillus endoradicis]
MRKTQDWNHNWQFIKTDGDFHNIEIDESNFEAVTLPHTWNNIDGQSTVDYYKGKCWYRKNFEKPEVESGGKIFVKFEAVAQVAEVYVNGKFVVEHRGGYSAFFADITDYIVDGHNIIAVSADNAAKNVYPQSSDFTFFGGIYRHVTLITVPSNHFSFDEDGSDGVFLTPHVDGYVDVKGFVTGADNSKATINVLNAQGELVATAINDVNNGKFDSKVEVASPHLWQGIDDPYLYTAQVELTVDGQQVDNLCYRIGFRSFVVDIERGFILNGIETPLRGVAKHQCREDKGTAVSHADQMEDMELILEMGANTVRLSHYQYAPIAYDLADEMGLALWTEIPFITVFEAGKEYKENAKSQMIELIRQNYNHPSVIVWGLGNELTIGGESEALYEELRALNDLTHALDSTRLTALANMSLTKKGSALREITDIISYNQYLGWYTGTIENNAAWMDQIHEEDPNIAVGVSEYGADAVMKWHSSNPKKKDYTEEYQALYHEGNVKYISERPFLWATHVWNMFDFAAAFRDEGSSVGRNNKGLVTFDRKTKKEAFYLYKAYWSKNKFVHICGRRYVQRAEEKIEVKIYSNCERVTLSINNGEKITQEGNKIFIFNDVPLVMGENTLLVTAPGGYADHIVLERVAEPNAEYVLPVVEVELSDEVEQWFINLVPKSDELSFPEGYYSVRDDFDTLFANAEAAEALQTIIFEPIRIDSEATGVVNGMQDVATKAGSITFEAIWEFLGKRLPSTAILLLNEKLTQIKK